MTMQTQTPALFENLPIQLAPVNHFVDLHTLVPMLIDLYPEWSEEDLRGFVEEKTRNNLDPEAIITLRAVYLRCYKLRREFEGL